MNIIKRPLPPELEKLPDNLDLYADALRITLHQPRRPPIQQQVANFLYWIALGGICLWVFTMAIDREPPVVFVKREIVNPEKQVHQGEQIQVRSTRVRKRQCELTRRWAVIDGVGRRIDYEPEHFDAYGEIGDEPDTDITGPTVTLDAAPGRGRLITSFGWDCNILQRALNWSIDVVPKAVEFEILPRRQKP